MFNPLLEDIAVAKSPLHLLTRNRLISGLATPETSLRLITVPFILKLPDGHPAILMRTTRVVPHYHPTALSREGDNILARASKSRKLKQPSLPPLPAHVIAGANEVDAIFDKWQEEELARARDLYLTPDYVHTARRAHAQRKQEAEEIERAKVKARMEAECEAEVSHSKAKSGELEEYRSKMARAVREAKSVKQFCEYLDRDAVPTPKAWNVKSWFAAHANPDLQSAIRSVKRRYR
jgi:hypothetical protein